MGSKRDPYPAPVAHTSMKAGRIRVVLAEDHVAMAAQLRAVLKPACEVVATVTDGVTLLAAVDALTPDVIVTDITMPGINGIQAAREILRRHPDACIVVVTVHSDALVVEQCLAAGARAYVLKATAGEELVPAIRAALQGRRFVSPQVATPARDSDP
jgi:DNA-binding NarL/FixJ family response regulator